MSEQAELIGALRAAVEANTAPGHELRQALSAVEDPALLRRAGRVLAGLGETGALREVRVGVLATCTIGPYADILRAKLVGAGLRPTIVPGPYGAFEPTLGSGQLVRRGELDVLSVLLDESYFLPADWSPTDLAGLAEHVTQRLTELRGLLAAGASTATVLLHTLPLPAQLRDSVLSWRDRAALSRIWHQLNADLLGLAETEPGLAVIDLVSVLADAPVAARDDRLHRYGDLPFSDGALVALATETRRFVQARSGLSRKVLALDLDNTLWGGVLGEVGAHGVQLGGLYPGNSYLELQRTVARLRDQGVVLVLASKNDGALVEAALTDHPEVVLRPEAFSASVVNWAPKSANLRAAADSLGLSTESFVFLDDSPFERGEVGAELPEIAVLSAEGDPAHLVRTLLRPGLFDVPELTDTDRSRPALYRTRSQRSTFSTGFGSTQDYLRALDIELTPAPADAFSIGRIAQLAARTNQFNLTGIRYDEPTTAALAQDPDHLVASFAVRDRFGDEGIIGAAWVERGDETWRVRNLVLSCRVLGRDVELAVAHWLVTQARAAGAHTVEGAFVPSKKNAVAADFWTRAGFRPVDGVFRLTADEPTIRPDWVAITEEKEVPA